MVEKVEAGNQAVKAVLVADDGRQAAVKNVAQLLHTRLWRQGMKLRGHCCADL